jgi:hypothetical protein
MTRGGYGSPYGYYSGPASWWDPFGGAGGSSSGGDSSIVTDSSNTVQFGTSVSGSGWASAVKYVALIAVAIDEHCNGCIGKAINAKWDSYWNGSEGRRPISVNGGKGYNKAKQ